MLVTSCMTYNIHYTGCIRRNVNIFRRSYDLVLLNRGEYSWIFTCCFFETSFIIAYETIKDNVQSGLHIGSTKDISGLQIWKLPTFRTFQIFLDTDSTHVHLEPQQTNNGRDTQTACNIKKYKISNFICFIRIFFIILQGLHSCKAQYGYLFATSRYDKKINE